MHDRAAQLLGQLLGVAADDRAQNLRVKAHLATADVLALGSQDVDDFPGVKLADDLGDANCQ